MIKQGHTPRTIPASASGAITTGDRSSEIAAHTPGPWCERWDYKKLARDTGSLIAHACGPQHSCKGVAVDGDQEILQPDKKTMERVFADARLIAASPDMLAALVHVEAIMSIVPPRTAKAEYLAALDHVREAIAKATAERSPVVTNQTEGGNGP